MIREQIKKDLKKAVEKSRILQGNFLDNIEWLLKTINKDNFEDFTTPVPVGKLRPEVKRAIEAEDDLVYLKPRIYGKIRGWWEAYPGHPEITLAHFFLLPLLIYHPGRIYQDKDHPHRVLFVVVWDHPTALIVELYCQGGRNEIVTFSLVKEKDLRKLSRIWETKKRTADEGTAISPILAPVQISKKLGRVAGCRFSGLRQKVQDYLNTIEKECQVDVLSYPKVRFSLEDIHLEHPANPEHGDYASNFAMTKFEEFSNLNFQFSKPLDLAELIVSHFSKVDYLERVEAAPPGFINFHLSQKFLREQVREILRQKGDYGIERKGKVQVEFISANPTGPLHAGNGRGGFAGDVLANILEKVGYDVQREYYINDKGVQVEKLAESVEACYKKLLGQKAKFPEDGYPGEYVQKIAQKMLKQERSDFKEFALAEIMQMIKKTTERMGIKYNCWFSERSLYNSSEVQKALDFVKKKGLIYEKDDATWFKSSSFGDDKDRVLIKSGGEMTYFLSDLAYHINKFEKRRFDRVILFWGADHHGYIPRFQAMIEAIGHKGKAQIELCQLLKLERGGKEVRMSKRAGEYITVDDVLEEIGKDAARFHFLMYPLDTPMTLDLVKAAEQSEKNPVFYVQYAHARICSILRKSRIKNRKSKTDFSPLSHSVEISLIRKLLLFPELIIDIAENRKAHHLPFYTIELADLFHKFYEQCRVLGDDEKLEAARLGLVKATQVVLSEALSLMGIEAPERM